jgi:hypothetical protein
MGADVSVGAEEMGGGLYAALSNRRLQPVPAVPTGAALLSPGKKPAQPP